MWLSVNIHEVKYFRLQITEIAVAVELMLIQFSHWNPYSDKASDCSLYVVAKSWNQEEFEHWLTQVALFHFKTTSFFLQPYWSHYFVSLLFKSCIQNPVSYLRWSILWKKLNLRYLIGFWIRLYVNSISKESSRRRIARFTFS